MRFEFKTRALQELYTDEKGAHRYPLPVVEAFFEVMGAIAAARDERDIRALKSLHYHKLQGARSHQHALTLYKGFRLIVERQKDEQSSTCYHSPKAKKLSNCFA